MARSASLRAREMSQTSSFFLHTNANEIHSQVLWDNLAGVVGGGRSSPCNNALSMLLEKKTKKKTLHCRPDDI